MPPFLCLASRLKGCSVTLKDAGSAASEPWLTALHPPSLGAPLGDTGLSLPHSPWGRSSDRNGIAGAKGGAAPGCPPLLGRPLLAGWQDCVLLRPTGRRWGCAPCPHEVGTCLT